MDVHMEVPIVHFIKRPLRLDEAVVYVSERSFEISSVLPVNYDSSGKASHPELDCFWQKVE